MPDVSVKAVAFDDASDTVSSNEVFLLVGAVPTIVCWLEVLSVDILFLLSDVAFFLLKIYIA